MLVKWILFRPDDSSGSGSGGGDGGNGGSGTPDPEPQEGAPEPQAGTGDKSQAEIEQLRKENAARRKELREAQARVKELEGQSQTEVEKLTTRLTDLEKAIPEKDQRIRNLQAQVLGGKAGIAEDARADAARLLDWSSISDPDDDAEVEKALRDLVKEKPYLAGSTAGGADGGTGGSRDGSQGDMNARLRAAAGRTR